MYKNSSIWLVVLAVGIGLIFYSYFSGNSNLAEVDSENNTSGETASPEPTLNINPTPTPTHIVNIPNKYPPAECNLNGKIVFLSSSLYENQNANLDYKNIDSKARHINWTITPQDDLSVGPNLFATLPVPNGTEDVTAGLPENPKYKNYILTAKVTYGVFVNGNLEIKDSSCSGQIPVELKY